MYPKLIAMAIICAVFSIPAIAANGCTHQTKYAPATCPAHLPPVVLLYVEDAPRAPPFSRSPEKDCSSFVVNEDLARDFFSKARAMNPPGDSAYEDWASCYASGTLMFKNRKSAVWKIYQFRLGSLTYDGKPEQFFYCDDCRVNSVPVQ